MPVRPIREVAADLGLTADDLIPYGHDKAKLPLRLLPAADAPTGRLVLVSAVTPTPAGEGKTTTTIGLTQALHQSGVKVCAALREPSLGPCFGIKGGGTGGGQSQLHPTNDINLHFTGDFHAITAAHNLLAAAIDNHLHFGNALGFDVRRVLWPRVLDVNERALRQVMVGLGGVKQGVPRETSFDITAASEIMAILCLSDDMADLRKRLDSILLGFSLANAPIYARELEITGALVALLKDALQPNLVQTCEGAPAIVHGGPFANIAHGCNSVIATRTALGLADWVITEAGFGCDLGAEKFFDIKCVGAGLKPSLVVLVATVRALKMHGGVALKDLKIPDADAVARGLCNLEKHLETVAAFGVKAVVALNSFYADTDDEVAVVAARCAELGVPFAHSDHFMRGGEGAKALAEVVLATAPDAPPDFTPMYQPGDAAVEKIRKVARTVYGAKDVVLAPKALGQLRRFKAMGFGDLPICMAKTQNSLSDNPNLRGRPEGFVVKVREVRLNTGAGFLVVLTGDIVRMPGLPRVPQAVHIDVVDGEIKNLR